ncbi:hypothetical protein KAR91_34615 [Candidatus Pacearchaeota archaeon]|nr:hypothetical protein [Candidatus Pacearchaeota archaeon]
MKHKLRQIKRGKIHITEGIRERYNEYLCDIGINTHSDKIVEPANYAELSRWEKEGKLCKHCLRRIGMINIKL